MIRKALQRLRRPAVQSRLQELVAEVDARLEALIPPVEERPERVHEAMSYALLAPGKRLRPVLTLTVAEMLGEITPQVLDLSCAIEMVHACSLVLDDMPMMDDATLRRGRETTHLVYGDYVAILASFGLLNRAFGLVAERAQELTPSRYTSEDLIHLLTEAVGSRGLVGGQALDLEAKDLEAKDLEAKDLEAKADVDLDRLEFIHSHKTGALFTAAAELGAMAVDARRRDLGSITRYAKNLGLAFQIADDLLDVLATAAETGKDSHQDEGKTTFVTLLGVAGAEALCSELLDFAVESLAAFGRKADPLRELAEVVRRRGRI